MQRLSDVLQAIDESLHETPSAQLQRAAQALVADAARLGLVLTVEQRPLTPLAMGHYETVVSVRPARGSY